MFSLYLPDFVLRPLNPFYHSIEGSVPNNVFIWQVISPELAGITGSSVNYLSAACGDNLHLEPMVSKNIYLVDSMSKMNTKKPQIINIRKSNLYIR